MLKINEIESTQSLYHLLAGSVHVGGVALKFLKRRRSCHFDGNLHYFGKAMQAMIFERLAYMFVSNYDP